MGNLEAINKSFEIINGKMLLLYSQNARFK